MTFIDSDVKQLSTDVHEVLILMELYTGQSVVNLLNTKLARRSTLTEPEVLQIFCDVISAMARLHHRTKPIIHRDLKVNRAGWGAWSRYEGCVVWIGVNSPFKLKWMDYLFFIKQFG